MQTSFRAVELAFEYVSSQPQFTNHAFICRDTGRIFYTSDLYDTDEDCPDDVAENDQYISLPHKNDLDLGTRLVRAFTRERAPQLDNQVREIFSRKGAYSRFKALLESNRILNDWYEYEERQSMIALKEWCRTNGIDLRQDDETNGIAT